jgi:hypothetical protein
MVSLKDPVCPLPVTATLFLRVGSTQVGPPLRPVQVQVSPVSRLSSKAKDRHFVSVFACFSQLSSTKRPIMRISPCYPFAAYMVATCCILSEKAVTAYSVGSGGNTQKPSSLANLEVSPNGNAVASRRDWLLSSSSSAAVAFGLLGSPKAASAESKLSTFDDPTHGFSISVPEDWTKSTQLLNDRRSIVVWTDPADAKTALFIAYTPVRDDFTSLASFGPVDQVAAQTILPKSNLGGIEGVEAEMISAESKKQAYFFDYFQSIENVQPPTHFRTIFTLQQGATGGAGAVLVTLTLQTPEERYSSVKPLFDAMMDSYGKSKA